jgi:hypothetical protein
MKEFGNPLSSLSRDHHGIVGFLIGLIFTMGLLNAQPSRKFYPIDDEQAEFKEKVENIMGLYLVDPPRRHESELLQWDGKNLHFHLWLPIASFSDEQLIDKALNWLIFGRIRYSQGARGILSDYMDINHISLSFHEIQRKDPQSNENEKINPYLMIKISRSQFESITDLQEIRECQNECMSLIKRYGFSFKMDKKYMQKSRAAD